MSVDTRALVDPAARLAEDVQVGPFSIIGPEVEIGPGSVIGPHVVIQGPTTIGANNRIFQFASLGEIPQDKKYHGEDSRLEIGDGNTIREFVTINRGTAEGGGVTRIGDDNWLMAYIHIAHDCQIGDHTIFANGASLAGHVVVEDHAILGGFTLVHQFCQIGAHAFCGMGSAISKDVPPFVMADGNPAHARGLNLEGLKRRGFDKETLQNLRRAYKLIYRSGLTVREAVQQIRETLADDQHAMQLADFLARAERGIVR